MMFPSRAMIMTSPARRSVTLTSEAFEATPERPVFQFAHVVPFFLPRLTRPAYARSVWAVAAALVVVARRLIGLPAVLTPLRRVGEPLLAVELLLACRPHELLPAVGTRDGAITLVL
jgi:hypothetical protein